MGFVGKFFLLVTAIGFAELYLLVEVAARLSFGVTLGLCVLTGVLGGALVRHQGLRTLAEVQRSMARGQVPAEEIVSGLTLLLVGATLLLPGFVSDAVGFALLVPPLRRRVAALLVRRFKGRVNLYQGGPPAGFWPPGPGPEPPLDHDPPPPSHGPGPARRPPVRAEVIEVESSPGQPDDRD